jgi:Spy/CpxP family protein refolding chaperone
MKQSSTLMLAALLVGGAALAASTPSVPTATPAPAAQPAHKHGSAMHCEKLARTKGLKGDDEKKFVKECREGKKPA